MKYLAIILSLIVISCSSKEIKILEQNQVEIKECIIYEKEEKKPFTGKVISKYQTEQLKSEISYKNGQRDRLFKKYYLNGQIESELNYKNGELDGCSKLYYSNGQIKKEAIFKKGIIKSGRDYKEDGTLESSYSGDNFFVEVFTTGVLYIFMPLTPFFN